MTLNRGYDYRERIGSGGDGQTVLFYLARKYPHSTSREWSARIREGRVLLDESPAGPESILHKGQRLTWRRPPWDEPEVPLFFDVLHEDVDLLAVAKPGGLPTMPAGNFLEHTLLTLVQGRYPGASPAHRLGRGTSGIVLFALTQACRSYLAKAFRNREIRKVYRALVVGHPVEEYFSVKIPIGPVPHSLLGRVHAASPCGKSSRSNVRVLEYREESSLVRVRIKTGRPHQIRIHMAAAGHPLVGDPLYTAGGGFQDSMGALPGDTGYLLHAERVKLEHPRAGEVVTIGCPPPWELMTEKETMPAGEL